MCWNDLSVTSRRPGELQYLNDWIPIGNVLARLAAKYDYEEIGHGPLTNDALMATSAGRLGITVITANA